MDANGGPLLRGLAGIKKWVSIAPKPADLADESAFMRAICDAMARALYLLHASIAVVPNGAVAARGVSRHRAIVLGHMVRLSKLFDAFYMHVAKDQLEIVGILARLIIETEIRISYLITKGNRASVSSYILASYRPERDCLLDLKSKAATRPLSAIEKRIRDSIKQALREDRIRERDLLANRRWHMDGKDARAMLRDLGREWEYGHGFAMQSRWVHGSWLELKNYHLAQKGRYYLPELRFAGVDTRMAAPLTWRCLDVAARYLSWSKGDPDRVVRGAIDLLLGWIETADIEHERRLQHETP